MSPTESRPGVGTGTASKIMGGDLDNRLQQPPDTELTDTDTAYGASPIKRSRRTKAAIAELDQVIIEVIEADYPITLRGVYYRVVSAGAIEKTENGYRTVGRRLLDLRRTGQVPYDRITDGTRWVIHPRRYDSVEDALETTARMYRRAQIGELELPTRPTKTSDSRSRSFTGGSVEVDAIPAPILRSIVSDAIEQYLDRDQLAALRLAEQEERAGLLALAGREGGWM